MTTHSREVRQDIDDLASLVGDVIRDDESPAAFETVEDVRRAALAYRRGDADSRQALRELLDDLDGDGETVVARAFTSYFELINLAEERERVRAIRQASHEERLADSLEEAATDLADSDHAAAVLDDVLIEPTFTAHPTEARRKTIKSKLRAIATHLETLDERRLTDKEERQVRRDVVAEVTSLWQTPQVRQRSPTPLDEARNVLWYLENTLFDVVGEVYDEIEEALADAGVDAEVPKLFEFRSWAGSDRDGNPHVTTETTTEVLSRQRSVVVGRYRDELKRLSGILSQDGDRIAVGEAFEASLAEDRERFPDIADYIETRYPNEPYRQKLRLMRERLDRIDDVRPGGYDRAEELQADLEAIRDSLVANDADVVADAHLDPLVRQVSTFGFALASLDLRDHQENHTEAVTAALDRSGFDYAAMDEDERVEVLVPVVFTNEEQAPGLKKGGVLNVASTAAFQPGPLMAVYYASKSYVLSLSEALATELDGTGVTVTALCPGPTDTGFQSRADMGGSKLVQGDLQDPAEVARAGYRGMQAGEAVVVPGLRNKLLTVAVRLLPRSVVRSMVKRAQAPTSE